MCINRYVVDMCTINRYVVDMCTINRYVVDMCTINRYATRSCPLCKEQVSELEEEVRYIEAQLTTNSSSSTVREIVDRIEQFEHLVLLGEGVGEEKGWWS